MYTLSRGLRGNKYWEETSDIVKRGRYRPRDDHAYQGHMSKSKKSLGIS